MIASKFLITGIRFYQTFLLPFRKAIMLNFWQGVYIPGIMLAFTTTGPLVCVKIYLVSNSIGKIISKLEYAIYVFLKKEFGTKVPHAALSRCTRDLPLLTRGWVYSTCVRSAMLQKKR